MKQIWLLLALGCIPLSMHAQRHYQHPRIKVKKTGLEVIQKQTEQVELRLPVVEWRGKPETVESITPTYPKESLEHVVFQEQVVKKHAPIFTAGTKTKTKKEEIQPEQITMEHIFKRNNRLLRVKEVKKTNMAAWGILVLVSTAIVFLGVILAIVGIAVVTTLLLAFVFTLGSSILFGLGVICLTIGLIDGATE